MNDLTLAARSSTQAARVQGLQQGLPAAAGPRHNEALMGQARKFEGFFVNMLLTSMRKTVMKSEMFDGGQAEQIFTGMFDQAISEEAAQGAGAGRGIGIADMLYGQLAPLVEHSRQAAARLAPQTNVEGEANGR